VVHNDEEDPSRKDSGTSFAAPAVAGIIATHMNYEPWGQGKIGLEKVTDTKKWLTKSESSWGTY
jgi:hypothetical protein